MSEVLICGYFGFGNFGDEVAGEHLVEVLARSGITATTTAPPARGAAGFARRSWSTYRAARSSELVVLGPGGVLKPTRGGGSASLLAVALGPVLLAAAAGRRSVCYGVDVSNIGGRTARALLRFGMRFPERVWVRDEATHAFLTELVGARPPVVARADSLFALAPADGRTAPAPASATTRIGLSLSASDLVNRSLPAWFGAALAEALGDDDVELIGLHGGRDGDISLGAALLSHDHRPPPARTHDLSGATWAEASAVIGALDVLVAARFHAAVVALSVGTPVVGLAYSPKVHRLLARFGLGHLALSPDADQLAERLAEAIALARKERDETSASRVERLATEHALAIQAESELVQLVRSPDRRPVSPSRRLAAGVAYAVASTIHLAQAALDRRRRRRT